MENVKTTTAKNGSNKNQNQIGDYMTHVNFLSIDNNRIATAKQVYGVACHFANIHAKNPSERYGLTKVFNAILNKFYSESDSYMTHAEVTDFREHQVVPKKFLKLIAKPKKKATAKKVSAKTSTKAVNSVAKGFDDRISKIEERQDSMDSKLDAMLEILQSSKTAKKTKSK